MGTFTISKKENGLIKFEFNSRKGKTLLTSQSYKTKEECEKDIDLLNRKFTTELLLQKGLDEIQNKFTESEILDFSQEIFFD